MKDTKYHEIREKGVVCLTPTAGRSEPKFKQRFFVIISVLPSLIQFYLIELEI